MLQLFSDNEDFLWEEITWLIDQLATQKESNLLVHSMLKLDSISYALKNSVLIVFNFDFNNRVKLFISCFISRDL